MNPYLHFRNLMLSVLLAALPGLCFAAQPTDPLWLQARRILDGSRNLVADVVLTDMEMFDDGGKSLGTMRIQEKITEWKNGEPVRVIVSNNNPEYGGVAKARFKVLVDNHPDQGIREITWLERLPALVFDGKTCAVFATSGKKGKYTFKSKVWIEEESGLPLKVLHEFDAGSMAKSMTHSIIYGMGEQRQWLPASAVVDVTVSMLFNQMRIVSKYQFNSWISRPKDVSLP